MCEIWWINSFEADLLIAYQIKDNSDAHILIDLFALNSEY